MKRNFDGCMVELFRHEGGYVNHKQDPGGETNYGISKRSYPSLNIKGLTKAAAKQIYKRDFWDKVRGDELPTGLDNVTFDPAVNSGPSRGVKWLQAALGVQQDGVIGPATLTAAKQADPYATVRKACSKRLAWLRGLGTFSTFGKGWSRRVAEVEAFSMKLLAQENGVPVSSVRKEGEADANKKAQAEVTKTGGVAAGSGVTSYGTDADWQVIALFVVVVVVFAILALRKRQQQVERARAYSALTED